jgi:hypothetical protein
LRRLTALPDATFFARYRAAPVRLFVDAAVADKVPLAKH